VKKDPIRLLVDVERRKPINREFVSGRKFQRDGRSKIPVNYTNTIYDEYSPHVISGK